MSLVEPAGIHHLRLTVTDLDRSCVFCQNLPGFAVAVESEGPAYPVCTDPARLCDGVAFETNGMLFELHPVAAATNWFDAERVGLDHFSFSAPSTDELSLMTGRLDDLDIAHGQVAGLDSLGIAMLSFSDPDKPTRN
ncbi:VOC family protein [Nocardia sp. NPDC004278]